MVSMLGWLCLNRDERGESQLSKKGNIFFSADASPKAGSVFYPGISAAMQSIWRFDACSGAAHGGVAYSIAGIDSETRCFSGVVRTTHHTTPRFSRCLLVSMPVHTRSVIVSIRCLQRSGPSCEDISSANYASCHNSCIFFTMIGQ